MEALQPIERPRLPYLDFLRGIAVLGLLTMNLAYMGLLDPEAPFPVDSTFDDWVLALQAVLLDGRFRSLFCLLFGIGLYLQFTRYQQRGLNAVLTLKSRLHWLLVFGLSHCIFIWSGDILILYALAGLVVIKRLENSTEQLFKRGCVYFAIGMIIQILLELLLWWVTTYYPEDESLVAILSLQDVYAQNIGYAFIYIITFPLLSMFYICGLMYIGIALYRQGALQHGFSKKQLINLMLATFVFSLADLLVTLDVFTTGIMTDVLSSISGLAMALLFWHWLLKSKYYISASWLVQSVSALGRKALTFYIFQSLVMTTLLRFIFPQWNNEFALAHYFLLALAFIPVQLALAYYIDKFFSQGPLEFYWRYLVTRKSHKIEAQ
ncbi:DUF418 domain-containing protein [Thalassotalea sp. PLHSN55]|uniref:DUF418 domain-containing protein n=1 Tax=Thalassotalea sp. PLHSN55 TaxID=3435888 RepID=UPI003F8504F3